MVESGTVCESFPACAEGGAGGADAHVPIHCCAGQGRHSARRLHRHWDAHACTLAESHGVCHISGLVWHSTCVACLLRSPVSCPIAVASLQASPQAAQAPLSPQGQHVQCNAGFVLSQSRQSVQVRVVMSILASTGRCTAQPGTEGPPDQLEGRASAEHRQDCDREAHGDEQHQGKPRHCIAHTTSWDMNFASSAFCGFP